ncbi:uncharacterized protein LOC142558470 [Dermacentor variabilis]|uniref:uncharacterized protein LOC142558470 n=1 Tax=Dermacentor variabilis TaxID=34621 RepID=UPI003F5C993A
MRGRKEERNFMTEMILCAKDPDVSKGAAGMSWALPVAGLGIVVVIVIVGVVMLTTQGASTPAGKLVSKPIPAGGGGGGNKSTSAPTAVVAGQVPHGVPTANRQRGRGTTMPEPASALDVRRPRLDCHNVGLPLSCSINCQKSQSNDGQDDDD